MPRRAFPCFDEPEFKARFGVTLVVPDDALAVSNAAEASREPTDDGLVRITFHDTVRMSTYLLAMVVGPLDATEEVMVPGRERNIPLRVIHRRGQSALCAFALEVAQAALQFFEEYYDLPYPGDKVDLVAVPDFAFGAMENLGCITFRDVLLLVDPSTATPQELQRVADVINHELAHMWFGDLVTMKWWNGIWLNEAFATFMEVSATDDFRPEWDVWTTFGLARAAAFDTDSLLSTRPIEYEVRTAADAEAMFDILTYEKGCSVVRMLEQYLGPRHFRDGIREYLRLNAWGNTDTTDLWDALEDATGEPVRRVMDEWIFRGGHPLVTVECTPEGVQLDQRRALLDPDATPSQAEQRFPVPMVLEMLDREGNSRTERLMLEDRRVIAGSEGVTRVQANVGGNGFFRTLLDAERRRELAVGGASPLERFVLLDDTWFAALAGHLGTPEALATVAQVVGANGGEGDPSVWRRTAGICADLRRLGGSDQQEDLADWIRGLLAGPRSRFPADGTMTDRAAEVAAILLSASAIHGEDPSATTEARELFSAGCPDAALSAAALEVVARHASGEEHVEIERRWREAATPQDEQRNLAALVLAGDPVLFTRALELIDTDVRTQDAPYVLRRASVEPPERSCRLASRGGALGPPHREVPLRVPASNARRDPQLHRGGPCFAGRVLPRRAPPSQWAATGGSARRADAVHRRRGEAPSDI